MTFNVRQMDGEDGPHAWEHRRHVLAAALQLHRPHILGTQETWAGQTAYILEQMPEYAGFGRGRYGDERDKHCKVFYRREEFTLREAGEIWISKTPDVPGSADWHIPKPRMITWGTLRDRAGSDLLVMNTHFPYGRGADEARLQATRLVLEKLRSLSPQLPVLLMGDFNVQAEGESHRQFTSVIRNAWLQAAARRGPEATVHGF